MVLAMVRIRHLDRDKQTKHSSLPYYRVRVVDAESRIRLLTVAEAAAAIAATARARVTAASGSGMVTPSSSSLGQMELVRYLKRVRHECLRGV